MYLNFELTSIFSEFILFKYPERKNNNKQIILSFIIDKYHHSVEMTKIHGKLGINFYIISDISF